MSVLIVLGCLVLATVAGLLVMRRLRQRMAERPGRSGSFPLAAEAALWSITEVFPDPHNALVLKDPTCEVRITEQERIDAAAAARASEAARARAARRRSSAA